jgi:hypothetical protein
MGLQFSAPAHKHAGPRGDAPPTFEGREADRLADRKAYESGQARVNVFYLRCVSFMTALS